MSDALDRIGQAREQAEAARTRLRADVAQFRKRTRPAQLAGDAARAAAAQAKARPLAMLAGVATLGLVGAVPKLRRGGIALGRMLWRNRIFIGRVIIAALPAARRTKKGEGQA